MPDKHHAALSAILDDVRVRLVAWLEQQGFDVPEGERAKVSDALVACLRIDHRSIQPRPRRVHRSKELAARQLDPDLQAAILVVQDEIAAGDDLNPRLTRRFFNAGFDDRLLNDLGVTHLHVGPPGAGTDRTGKRVMSGAGDDLLWVIVQADDAYLIDVGNHDAFSHYDFVQVVGDNWKSLLGKPLPGVSAVEPKLSPTERAKLRRIGIFTAVEYNREVFIPGGFMKSGASLEVVRASDAILNRLVSLYRWLANHDNLVIARIEELPVARPTTLAFRVGDVEALIGGRPNLIEQATGMLFYLDGDVVRRTRIKMIVPSLSTDRAST